MGKRFVFVTGQVITFVLFYECHDAAAQFVNFIPQQKLYI